MGQVVVTDATVIINFAHLDRLDVLGRVPTARFVLPPEVVGEIAYPAQAAALASAVGKGFLRVEPLLDVQGLEMYAQFRKTLGKGESACLALAAIHDWLLASDDNQPAFRRRVSERLRPGRMLNTVGIIVRAIQEGVVTLAEANAMIPVLAKHRFRLPFDSFEHLLKR
ncbi:MAG: hypothetical protein ACRD4Q_01645 [Candidatus Acidiferrales bacterium]